ncbi:Hypothetical protein CAP_1958 [Chondromyces apiculatus DSM 436]|uniref:Uncharacterized protein n=1 Tax=Chondromyces apiculatus DSM 436 TaxID=1192034 RepID=A0A017TAW6_9BACT|nr:Hypothetical protein CAP_1958 [Chondromyces apiculatus DSM 436]
MVDLVAQGGVRVRDPPCTASQSQPCQAYETNTSLHRASSLVMCL